MLHVQHTPLVLFSLSQPASCFGLVSFVRNHINVPVCQVANLCHAPDFFNHLSSWLTLSSSRHYCNNLVAHSCDICVASVHTCINAPTLLVLHMCPSHTFGSTSCFWLNTAPLCFCFCCLALVSFLCVPLCLSCALPCTPFRCILTQLNGHVYALPLTPMFPTLVCVIQCSLHPFCLVQAHSCVFPLCCPCALVHMALLLVTSAHDHPPHTIRHAQTCHLLVFLLVNLMQLLTFDYQGYDTQLAIVGLHQPLKTEATLANDPFDISN